MSRALLAASTYEEAMKILTDSNLSDGFSINMTFMNSNFFSNIEMGPALDGIKSQLSESRVENGFNIHCNHYLRLNVEEPGENYLDASKARYKTLTSFKEPQTKQDVLNMLGDTSHEQFYVFRCQPEAPAKTICVGIFDLKEKTWSLYKDNPKFNEPIVVLPLSL